MAAFDLPTVGAGLPTEGGVPYLGTYDSNNKIVQVAGMYFKNVSNLWVPVSLSDPLPTKGMDAVNTSPVVGVKTVTATAAEIFAGSSAKANRRKLILKNEDSVLRFRVGPSSVTQQNGFPVEPGAVLEFQFDPATAVPIYAIAEGASLQVAVMEV